MAFRIELLGPPRVLSADGTPFALSPGKPLALLAYLSLAPTPVSRAELAALLWGRSSARGARGSLRQALFTLRRELGADLIAGDDPLRVEDGVLEIDVREFRDLLARSRGREAMKLWRGPFLDGLVLSGVPGFEHWAENVGGDLAREFSAALLIEARALRAAGSAGDALPLLEKAIEVEPGSCWPRLRLAEAQAEAGSPAALTLLAEVERDSADADVAAEAARIRRLIRDHAVRGSRQQKGPASLPFVGRRNELAQLNELWRMVCQGNGEVRALVGPPGIGKTRLAHEFASLVGAQAGRTAAVRGIPAERPIPLGTVAELARLLSGMSGARGVTEASESVLTTLLPSMSRRTRAWPESGSDELAIFAAALSDAFHDLLGAVAYEGPLLMTIDDIQWADPASQAVLFRMARHTPSGCLLLLIERQENGPETLRTETEWRIRLDALDTEDVADLLDAERITQGRRGTTLASKIRRLTSGNPLFVGEVIRLLQERRDRDGSGDAELPLTDTELATLLPGTLRETTRRRLDALSADERQLLAVAARTADPQTPHSLQSRSRLPESRFRDAVGGLLNRTLLERIDGNLLSFVHEDIRQAVADILAPPRTRQRWAWTAVLVGMAAVVVVTTVILRGPVSPPFGGGALYVRGDPFLRVIGPGGTSTTLLAGAAVPVSGPDWLVEPRITTSGDTLWLGQLGQKDAGPVAVVHADGRTREIYRGDGDARVVDVSPDGAHLLLLIQDTRSPTYDVDLWIADSAGGGRRLLMDTPAIMSARWSPDGRLIAVAIQGPTDSLVVLRPGGHRISALGFRTIGDLEWCSDRLVTMAFREAGEPIRPWLIEGTSTPSPTVVPVGTPALTHSNVECSPDGSAILLFGHHDGRSEAFVVPLDGTSEPSQLGVFGVEEVAWLADPPEVVLSGIRIHGDASTLRRGERRSFNASVFRSDGREVATPIRWASSSPAIAFVDQAGVITANRPGTATVTASVDGWPVDSLTVRVSAVEEPGALLREPFATFDTSAWRVHGRPVPVVEHLSTGPALRLTGDGLYHDGIYSARSFDWTTGLTVEVEASIRATMPEKQRIELCLVEIPDLHVRPTGFVPVADQSACFTYPMSEGVKYDPTEAGLFKTAQAPQPVLVDSTFGDGGWRRLALQVEPDGTVVLGIDGQVAAVSTTQLRPSSAGLRVGIFGKGVDTDVRVRDLAVWSGLRYGR